MGKDITRVLVEATIQKTLKDIHESPERTLRNLVDLALDFSHGDFQKELLGIVQEMLQNKDSAYFPLAVDIISHVKENAITAFGLNVGYNGCSRGSKIIRQTEQKENFNIPWSLSLQVCPGSYRQAQYHALLEQGKVLGIYTYLLFTEDDPSFLFPLIEAQQDCAFVLFVSGKYITRSILEKTESLHHLMFAVQYDNYAQEACRLLRVKRFLYSLFFRYTNSQKAEIASGQLPQKAVALHPAFTFFIPAEDCSPATEDAVYHSLSRLRKQQKTQTFLMDLKYDNRFIDSIISDDACAAVFDSGGSLLSADSTTTSSLNFTKQPLRDILKAAFPKKQLADTAKSC